jgi:uncharacterized repeat protein (TIGR03803 family)
LSLSIHGVRRVAACAALAASAAVFAAPTLTIVHAFAGADGSKPNSGLVKASNGNLYGTTTHGGAAASCIDCGTLFAIKPDDKFKSLHSFEQADGAHPWSSLSQGTDGLLHGTTTGAAFNPTIFASTLQGAVSVDHAFLSGETRTGTAGPVLQVADGTLYGMTFTGGANSSGSAYSLAADGTFTTLRSFSFFDDTQPAGGFVVGPDGAFYATSRSGGTSGSGTVFRMTADGTVTTLHSFTGADGQSPYSDLVLAADGNFYGTTYGGGAHGAGTVFRIAPDGTFASLHSFAGADGSGPLGPLARGRQGRFLYGTTGTGGGSAACTNGCGTVFQITPDGTFTMLHAFSGVDGSAPNGTLALPRSGMIYGTTYAGGPNGLGVVFSLTTD